MRGGQRYLPLRASRRGDEPPLAGLSDHSRAEHDRTRRRNDRRDIDPAAGGESYTDVPWVWPPFPDPPAVGRRLGRVSHQGAELVRRMAGGDRQAFAAFYDGFAPLAYGLIRRILHDASDADEVLQEVFLELWRAAGQYDAARGTPAAWVVTRARSRAIDRLRSLRKRDEVAVDRLETMTAETSSGRPDDPGSEV